MKTRRRFPIVDLSDPNRPRLLASLDAACRDAGFFHACGHGVPEQTIAAAYRDAATFFALPLSDKLEVVRPSTRVSRGYNSLGENRHAATFERSDPDEAAVDVQESYAIGIERYASNRWPANPPSLRASFSDYFAAMERLAASLMALFALALGLPAGFFRDAIDQHASILRAVLYPEPLPDTPPGQLRAGAHTDFGTLTILHVDDAPGGLQVRDRGGDWLEVPPVPGAFIVNVADLLQRWTNSRWVSSVHRVVMPRPAHAVSSRRLSLVFFQEPNPDALVAPLPTCVSADRPARYAPIIAGDYRRGKVAALRGAADGL